MKKDLITSITGQDDAYLTEFFLEKGYEVHGIKRRASSYNTARIDHLYQCPHHQVGQLNNGSGVDMTIRDLADMLAEVVGYKGKITADPSKRGGTPQNLLSVDKMAQLGCIAKTPLRDGLDITYQWFLCYAQ